MPRSESFSDRPVEVPFPPSLYGSTDTAFGGFIGDVIEPTAGPTYAETTMRPHHGERVVEVPSEMTTDGAEPAPTRKPVTFTEADKERFYSALEAERNKWDLSQPLPEDAMGGGTDTLTFRKALRDQGQVAAAIILGPARTHISHTQAMEDLEICAGPDNAPDVIRLMHKRRDKYIDVSPLVRLLQRTADIADMPALISYAAGNRNPHETVGRLYDVLKIAIGAEQRELDPARRQQWTATIDEIAATPALDGDPLLYANTVDKLRGIVTAGGIAVEYASLFHLDGRNTDLNRSQRPVHPAYPSTRPDRTNAARNLHSIITKLGLTPEGYNNSPYILDELAYKEAHPLNYSVSIGMEIEITRQSLVDDSPAPMHEKIDQAAQKMKNITYVIGAGIPEDPTNTTDIKEFAHDAAHYYGTLSNEAQCMYALGVLNENGGAPLHVTLGNVSIDGSGGDEPFVLLRAMEMAGWSCTSERLLQPLREHNTWACKGSAGLSQRESHKVQLNAATALEFRTLAVGTQDGLDRTLRSMQGLGSAVSAYQSWLRQEDVPPDLAGVWHNFSQNTVKILAGHGIGRPDRWWVAKELNRDAYEDGSGAKLDPNFKRMATLLGQAEADPQSEGAAIQSKVQQQIIASSDEAFRILSEI